MEQARVLPRDVAENIRPTVCTETSQHLGSTEVPSETSLCMTRGPWRRSKNLFNKFGGFEPMFTLSKREYKVCEDRGSSLRTWVRRLAVLDTEAGPNFVRVNLLHSGYEHMLEHTVLPSVNDGNNRPLRLVKQISLYARLGMRHTKLRFLACQRLAAPAILGCEFCDIHVESFHVQ